MSRDPYRDDVRRAMAARTHGEADPNPKKTAALAGRTDRTARRWRTEGRGSPVDQLSHYIDAHPQPWRVLASLKASVTERVRKMTTAEVVARIRELHVQDALDEGEDNAIRARRGVCWLDRAQAADRDAASDIERGALYRVCAERRVPESEVFGG